MHSLHIRIFPYASKWNTDQLVIWCCTKRNKVKDMKASALAFCLAAYSFSSASVQLEFYIRSTLSSAFSGSSLVRKPERFAENA